MEYRISLTGDLGSGKSTVGKIIAAEKNCEMYSTGKICREIATKIGIPDIKEMNVYMKTHPEVDKQIDDGLVALSDRKGNLIVDSRMAWHFTKGTFKTYLSCSVDVAAERIFNDHRANEQYASVEDMKRSNIQRKREENSRYFDLYGVNIYDMTNYDLVVDTTAATPEAVAEAILRSCEDQAAGRPFADGLLCPNRLFPTKDLGEADNGEVTVCCADNIFYILSGHQKVWEAISAKKPLTPCRILPAPGDTDFTNYRETDYPAWFAAMRENACRIYSRA